MTGPGSAPGRRGHRRRGDIPAELLAALEGGEVETATLVEQLALDLASLMSRCLPWMPATAVAELHAARDLGITRRMALAGDLVARYGDADRLAGVLRHPSDSVRGWAAFALCEGPGCSLAERLDALRPLADDAHFGVREWAWMALRPHLAVDLDAAIAHLAPWTGQGSPRLRRFASEVTRPRGVWAPHLKALVQAPWRGLPILEPLQSDPDTYVQDSVANWLNDAARSDPAWVRALCTRWLEQNPGAATRRIARRATRNA